MLADSQENKPTSREDFSFTRGSSPFSLLRRERTTEIKTNHSRSSRVQTRQCLHPRQTRLPLATAGQITGCPRPQEGGKGPASSRKPLSQPGSPPGRDCSRAVSRRAHGDGDSRRAAAGVRRTAVPVQRAPAASHRFYSAHIGKKTKARGQAGTSCLPQKRPVSNKHLWSRTTKIKTISQL